MTKILDTTLRDGSYVIDFQFTAKDTALISAKLDDAGVHYIEVGHGWGMNAGTRDNTKSAESDEAYLEATKSGVKKGKWGMFFIPGIGRIQDIELAAKYGMDFIRIGTNVTEVEQSEKYIKRAKELGMYVFANYMKTYAVEPNEVGLCANKSAGYGADIVCIVDSAGGMMTEDVEAYFKAIKNHSDVSIGFHGHNNLGMAIANSLKASELGAAIIDTSIRGMGRSSGNAITEIFLLALKRRDIHLDIDVTRLLDLAEKVIDPYLKNYKQVDSIGIISGYAQFHSSFLTKIFAYAEKYKVDPRELIVRVSKEDKINAPDTLIERISKELSIEGPNSIREITLEIPTEKNAYNHSLSLTEKAQFIANQTSSLAKKWARTSIFNLVQGNRKGHTSFISGAIHEGQNYIVSSAEIYSEKEAIEILEQIDGKVEFILLDIDKKTPESIKIISSAKATLTSTKIIEYSDISVWSKSITQLLIQLLGGKIEVEKILVVGKNLLGNHLSKQLQLLGAAVETISAETHILELEKFSIVVFCEEMVSGVKIEGLKEQIIIDGWIGSLDKSMASSIHAKNIRMYRPEMNIFIHAEINAIMGCYNLVIEKQGLKKINNTVLVSGGIIAPEGSVIVDSVNHPTKVFGIADGRGFLIQSSTLTKDHIFSIKEVEKLIASLILN
jgi:4-hydroxy-2-oxovalerate aldolase